MPFVELCLRVPSQKLILDFLNIDFTTNTENFYFLIWEHMGREFSKGYSHSWDSFQPIFLLPGIFTFQIKVEI